MSHRNLKMNSKILGLTNTHVHTCTHMHKHTQTHECPYFSIILWVDAVFIFLVLKRKTSASPLNSLIMHIYSINKSHWLFQIHPESSDFSTPATCSKPSSPLPWIIEIASWLVSLPSWPSKVPKTKIVFLNYRSDHISSLFRTLH